MNGGAPPTTSSGRPILTQLAGVRCCASFWIILSHYMLRPIVPFGPMVNNRGEVPTGTFILLSGFVTHYAYHGKPYNTSTQVLRYYARRFGAILFSYYAVWLVMVSLSLISCALHSCAAPFADWGPGYTVPLAILSFFFLQAFVPTMCYFPNGPAWTISTMGLMWLLYPKLLEWLRKPLAQRPFALALAAAIACQLPSLAAFFAGCVSPSLGRPFYASSDAGLWAAHFPPLRIADFVLGMALAQALADGRASQASRAWAWVADGLLLTVWACCWLIPEDPRANGRREGYEPLFIGGMQPLIGMFVFASSCAGASGPRGSVAGRVLRHPVLRSLGEYSFQVYLWQMPLGLLFFKLERLLTGDDSGGHMKGSFLLPFLLALWLFSAAVSIHAEEPFRKWLRARIDAWAERREAAEATLPEAALSKNGGGHAHGNGNGHGNGHANGHGNGHAAALEEGAGKARLLASGDIRSDELALDPAASAASGH